MTYIDLINDTIQIMIQYICPDQLNAFMTYWSDEYMPGSNVHERWVIFIIILFMTRIEYMFIL